MVHKICLYFFLKPGRHHAAIKKNQGYNWLLEMFYSYELLGLSAIYFWIYAYRFNVALRCQPKTQENL
jgi:hypothetical protein